MPKISVIVPCYNCANYIDRLLNSLLEQTTNDFEIVLVDDGSVDNTYKVILSYKSLFYNKNIDMRYFYKDNGGPASAINMGLKYINGKYFIWPDSDDYYEKNALKILSDFLDQNEEFAFVKGNHISRRETNLEEIIQPNIYFSTEKECFFEDYLFVSPCIGCFPGVVMVRTNCFICANNGLDISNKFRNVGQNFQLLLPITYAFKGKFITDVIYNYIIRKDSHSHSMIGKKIELENTYSQIEVIIETFNRMKITSTDKKKYIKMVQKRYSKIRIKIVIKYSLLFKFLRSIKHLLL